MTDPAPSFIPVDTGSLVGEVTRQLYDAIVTGRLVPGQRLVEAEVARQMGISRAPVREAARRLEQMGIVVAEPRRGFFVRQLGAKEIDDVYGLRLCLEVYGAGLAARVATAEDLAALAAQAARLAETATQGEMHAMVEADLTFHGMICAASGNARLKQAFDGLASEVRMIIALIGRLYDDPVRIADTHGPIMDLLRARDAEGVRQQMETHIGTAWRQVRQTFAERG